MGTCGRLGRGRPWGRSQAAPHHSGKRHQVCAIRSILRHFILWTHLELKLPQNAKRGKSNRDTARGEMVDPDTARGERYSRGEMVQREERWYSERRDGTARGEMVQREERWYSERRDGTARGEMVQREERWYSERRDGTARGEMVDPDTARGEMVQREERW